VATASHIVEGLLKPESYPHKPAEIKLVQTQMSFVFLTGEYVYKVKKPVNLGFLDYTTLSKRHLFCRQELELNRRLCPDVYLDVVAITGGREGVRIGGKGRAVEYAVKMRQLPQERMMDVLLAANRVTPEMVARVAQKLVDFHREAKTDSRIAAFGGLDIVRQNTDENFSQTREYIGVSLSQEQYERIKGYTGDFIRHNGGLFARRVKEGRIRDCHGDLHCAHICFTDGICIYDCIEFNDRFRYSDVAADITFLLMDLDYHRHPLLSSDLAAHYLRISRDWPLYLLLEFYKSYRAYVLAKVTSFRLEDPNISAQEKAFSLGEARRYYRLSHAYTARMNRPMLAITAGLIGTGKSTIARYLAEPLGWEWLRVDVLRKKMAQISPLEHRFEKFHRGIYSPDFSRKTYQALFDRARSFLDGGKSVILDGSFKKRTDRTAARDLAQETQADFLLIECSSSDEEIHKRLVRRAREKNEPSDGRAELLAEQKRDYEPVEGFDPALYLPLNTECPPQELLARIFRHLLEKAGRELENAVK